MYSAHARRPSPNCQIESVSVRSARVPRSSAESSDSSPELLALTPDSHELILNQELDVEVQLLQPSLLGDLLSEGDTVNNDLNDQRRVCRTHKNLSSWHKDVLYVEIREVLFRKSGEQWKNVYSHENEPEEPDALFQGGHVHENVLSLGEPTVDAQYNVHVPLRIRYISTNACDKNTFRAKPGNYKLELRLFQYTGETVSVFLPFVITPQSLESLQFNSSDIDTVSDAHSETSSSSHHSHLSQLGKSTPVRQLLTKLSTQENYMYYYQRVDPPQEYSDEHASRWVRRNFNRKHHIHFDSSKHNPTSTDQRTHRLRASSPREMLSNSLNLSQSTIRKALSAVASKNYSSSAQKKSTIIFVIGNGIDQERFSKQIASKRLSILRPKRITNPIPDMENLENIQRNSNLVQSLLTNAPFCPIIYYDLNNGRANVNLFDIKYAFHFIHERAANRKDVNVVVFCGWSYRRVAREEALDSIIDNMIGGMESMDSLSEEVSQFLENGSVNNMLHDHMSPRSSLSNVLIISSAGNDGQIIDQDFRYPAVCSTVLTVGSLENQQANAQQPLQINRTSNRGTHVNVYVPSQSTSYGALYITVLTSLLWLLKPELSRKALASLLLREGCVCRDIDRVASSWSRALAFEKGDDVVRSLLRSSHSEDILNADTDEENKGGIIIEEDSNDEDSDELNPEDYDTEHVRIQGGGMAIESVDDDSEEDESDWIKKQDSLPVDGKGKEQNSSLVFQRQTRQYLHTLRLKVQKHKLNVFSSYNAYIYIVPETDAEESEKEKAMDVLKVFDSEKVDDISSKLLQKGNMNRVLFRGEHNSGKTIKLKRLIARICDVALQKLDPEKKEMSQNSMECPLIPFYVSLTGIPKDKSILEYVSSRFSSMQANAWNDSPPETRLLIVDDFEESFDIDRDAQQILDRYQDSKIILSTSQELDSENLRSLFHRVESNIPSLDQSIDTDYIHSMFGYSSNPQWPPISNQRVQSYISWTQNHMPFLLRNPLLFFSLIHVELYRKRCNLSPFVGLSDSSSKARRGLRFDTIISKLLNHLVSDYQRYQNLVEDLSHEFVEALPAEDLSLSQQEDDSASISQKKQMMKKILLPLLSLLAFQVTQSPQRTFSFDQIIKNRGNSNSTYDFMFAIIQKNIKNFKLLERVNNSNIVHGRSAKPQYRFVDPLFMTLLTCRYLYSTFSSYKAKKQKSPLRAFYEDFYHIFYDPVFYEALVILRGYDQDFRKFLKSYGISEMLDQQDEEFEKPQENRKTTNESQASPEGLAASIDRSIILDTFNEGKFSSLSASVKRDLILQIMDASQTFTVTQSESLCNSLISQLSSDNDSITQQYLLKAICKLSVLCNDSIIQVIVRSIQIIAADKESEIRSFAIGQMRNFASSANLEQMLRFLVDLFKSESDSQLCLSILDTIYELLQTNSRNKRSIWFEICSIEQSDDESVEGNKKIRASLLKTMSLLIDSPSHFEHMMQRLRDVLGSQSIGTVDALSILRELAAKVFSLDNVHAVVELMKRLNSETDETTESECRLVKIEIIGQLLKEIEKIHQNLKVAAKGNIAQDDSLIESLIDKLFGLFDQNSIEASQRAVDALEQLPEDFSHRTNILKRIVDRVVRGSTGQSILTKRMIRLFDKFMNRGMDPEAFWSCYVKLGYIVSDYDIEKTAQEVAYSITLKKGVKEARIMMHELVRNMHEKLDRNENVEPLKRLIRRLYHHLTKPNRQ